MVHEGPASVPGQPGPSGQESTAETLALTWHQRCGSPGTADEHGWPHDEAVELAAAIARVLGGDPPTVLAAPAAAWGRAHGSMSVLVRRLGHLRDVVGEAWQRAGGAPADHRLQQVLDQVTARATQSAVTALEHAALTDTLTGAGNRRALELAARAALATATRAGDCLSVVAIDLDGLKQINDTAGHAAGDRALAALAGAMRSAMRRSDQLFRVGGDEFVALLPLTPTDAVEQLVQRAVQHGAPAFSWGAATAPGDGTDLDHLLHLADARLYERRHLLGRAGRRTQVVLGHPARSSEPAGAFAALPAANALALRSRRRARRRAVAGIVPVVLAASVAAAVVATGRSPEPSGPRVSSTAPVDADTGSGPGSPGAGGAPVGRSGAGPSGADAAGTAGAGSATTATTGAPPATTTSAAPGTTTSTPRGATTTTVQPTTTTTEPTTTSQPGITLPLPTLPGLGSLLPASNPP